MPPTNSSYARNCVKPLDIDLWFPGDILESEVNDMGKNREPSVGKMSEFDKAKQEAREIYDLYKGSATARAKRFANEEHRSKLLGGKSACRITIPALKAHHLDSAVYHLSNLVEQLKDAQKSEASTIGKMYLLRSYAYQCHRNLKVDADRGYSDPRRPYEDFRGAR